MSKQRSTFGKIQRERDKAEKQAAKRERRAALRLEKLAATDEDSPGTDEQALVLRRKGRSFSSIARDLGIPRATDANAAFLRAISRRPTPEKIDLLGEEHNRLDRMTLAVSADESLEAVEAARRLKVIDQMRRTLVVD